MKADYEEFVQAQKRRYDILLKQRRADAEKLRLKKLKEAEERKRQEAEEAERLRLKKLEEEAERKRQAEIERLRQLEAEEQRRQAEEKRLQLMEQLKIKGNVQEIINKEIKKLQAMQAEVETVEMRLREVELVHEKRAELCTDPNGLSDIKIMDKLLQDFTDLSESVQNDEEDIIAIGKKVHDSKQDAGELMDMTKQICDRIIADDERIQKMKTRVEKEMDKQGKLLNNQFMEIRRREAEAEEAARRAQDEIDAANAEAERLRLLAEEQKRLLEEEARRRRLMEEEEAARYAEEMRRLKLMEEEERQRRLREEEEERRRRELEDEERRRRQRELEEMEARLREEQEKIEEIQEQWKSFTWDEVPWDGEFAGEMIGCLANPALLAGIRDPKKRAGVRRSAKEMASIRERMRAEEAKLKYICKAIEEMQAAARAAEEKRWVRQNTEWIKDVVPDRPADLICSTQEASFAPTNFLSLEESRRQVVERKASRQQMAPVTLQVRLFDISFAFLKLDIA